MKTSDKSLLGLLVVIALIITGFVILIRMYC
ncbi:MAG: sortase B protein-sorting domain-containing protein [Dysgonamonadaceae bacterium]|jgi:hypothetical protein|nr:sortase B protein-sorting domain-containing protein [Dysgonamonadaceae bacterium]